VSKPTRPVLRWHGGKWLLAPWIISHFPAHRIYVEAFGGAASVLLRKDRAYAEYYSDLDGDVVNLFEVLRSPDADRLIDLLRLTPFARAEFAGAYEHSDDPIERARRIVVRSFMGFGSAAACGKSTGFRATSDRSGTTPVHDWVNFPETLAAVVDRLRGVVIENRPAMTVMAERDRPDALHYVDPPYVHETRARGNPYCDKGQYRHELSDDDHRELLAFLRELQGMVVLSGYPAPLYDELLPEWRRIERPARADGARDRTEVLWINPAAAKSMSHGPLFGEAA
jgi:DNA adenine methylase